MTVQRIAWNVECHVFGQFDGQILFLLGHHTAVVAMHHRDRTTPIALARQAPIAQAELGHALADPLGFAKRDGRIDGLISSLHLFAGKAACIQDPLGFLRYERFTAVFGCVV